MMVAIRCLNSPLESAYMAPGFPSFTSHKNNQLSLSLSVHFLFIRSPLLYHQHQQQEQQQQQQNNLHYLIPVLSPLHSNAPFHLSTILLFVLPFYLCKTLIDSLTLFFLFFIFFFTYLTLFSSVFPLQKTIFSCIFFPSFLSYPFPIIPLSALFKSIPLRLYTFPCESSFFCLVLFCSVLHTSVEETP